MYQTLINQVLRAFIESKGGHTEDMVRRVLREELAGYSVTRSARTPPTRKRGPV